MSGNRVCISRNLKATHCTGSARSMSMESRVLCMGPHMQTTLYTLSTARATPMTPNMVAEEVDISSSQTRTSSTRKPSAATELLPQLPLWSPRLGRNDAFIKWHDALINIEADLDIVLDEQQPSFQHLVSHPLYANANQEVVFEI